VSFCLALDFSPAQACPSLLSNEVAMRWIVLFAFSFFAACPGMEAAKPKPKICQTVSEQCQLEGGQLGVCGESTCEPGQQKPCLKCISQH
jgi:hypothetical protein